MSTVADPPAARDTLIPGQRAGGAARVGPTLMTFGVLATFVICFAVFAIAESSVFLTGSNMAGIANVAAIDALIAVGVTVPLIMRDFDLSVAAAASLGSALVVVLISENAWNLWAAITVVLMIGALIGLVNGVIVARLGASSFIATLAMGSVLTGVQYLLTDQKTVVGNLPLAFTDLGGVLAVGLVVPVFAAVAVAGVVAVALTQTAFGRYVHAIGSNPEAAAIVGLRVTRVRILGFVVAGMCAVLAGVFISTVSGNSFPDAGQSHLLPAFAAAFLGATLFPSRRFSALGAAGAAWLLQMIATGLVDLNLASWTINVFNGVVLIAAILTARRTLGRAA